MNTQKLLLSAAVLCGLTLCVAKDVSAQSPVTGNQTSRLDLLDLGTSGSMPTSPSDMRRSVPTAMELRQERALFQMRQRIERLEAAAWLGYSPLRPNWSAQPMMSSSQAPQRFIYIPVYVR